MGRIKRKKYNYSAIKRGHTTFNGGCVREDEKNCVVKEVQRVWHRAGFGGAIQTGSAIRVLFIF